MKIKISLLIFGILLACQSYGQKKKDRFVFSGSSINYYPELASYSFFSSLEREQDNLYLNFLTSNSGTFVLEEVSSTTIDVENSNKFPTQIFNLGFSFQLRNANSVYHEFSISRFSQFKSSYINNFTYIDLDGNDQRFRVGYEQKSFIMSLRYEFGKMFGKTKSKVRFGISGLVEPSIYRYNRMTKGLQEFPIKASIYSMRVAMMPTLAIKLSKKVFLDFKIIPTFLVADFGTVKVNNPTLSIEEQKGVREYDLPEINLASTIQLRFLLKEPKKKRRRSQK